MPIPGIVAAVAPHLIGAAVSTGATLLGKKALKEATKAGVKQITKHAAKKAAESTAKKVTKKAAEAAAENLLNRAAEKFDPKDYRISPVKRGLATGLDLIGDLSRGAGQAYNGYNSILGSALSAMAANMIPASEAAVYGNPMLATAPMVAAPMLAKGYVANIAGNVISDFTKGLSSDIMAEAQREKLNKSLVEQHPSGYYYNAMNQLREHKSPAAPAPAVPQVSDEQLKNILSDMDCKILKHLASKEEPLSEGEISFIKEKAGPFTVSEEDTDWNSNMLDAYAKHLRNYLYTYKEEAKAVDPRIDPNEEHVGPMAQDIEQVAPDCVKETPEGVKTVDGNRLALVNAGVLGDVIRKLDALEEKIDGYVQG